MSAAKKTDYTLSFDWIQFNCLGKFPQVEEITQINDSIVIKPLASGNKYYQRQSEIYYLGQLFAHVQHVPRASFRDPLSVVIKLDNVLCYEAGISDLCNKICGDLGLKFHNWTRIDFALDGHNLLQPLVNACEGRSIRLVGKSETMVFRNGSGKVKGAYVGKKTSSKSLTAYNKTEELKRSKKAYIREFWEYNGLDQSKDIERLEIRTKGLELRRYPMFTAQQENPLSVLDKLRNDVGLFERLFLSLSKKLYEFISKNAKRSNEAKRKCVLKLKNVGSKVLRALARPISSEISRMKQAAKTLFWCSLSTGKAFYDELSKDLAKMVDAQVWAEDSRKHWRAEYDLKNTGGRMKYLFGNSGLTSNTPSYFQTKLFTDYANQ